MSGIIRGKLGIQSVQDTVEGLIDANKLSREQAATLQGYAKDIQPGQDYASAAQFLNSLLQNPHSINPNDLEAVKQLQKRYDYAAKLSKYFGTEIKPSEVYFKILIANNGMAARNFLKNLRTFCKKVFGNENAIEAVTIATPEDATSGMAYFGLGNENKIVSPLNGVQPYQNIDELIRLSKLMGCDAIYAGWGWASELERLPREAAKNGITFIGPDSAPMGKLGNKTRGNLIMQHVAPDVMAQWSGSDVKLPNGEITEEILNSVKITSREAARAFGKKYGYPFMLKVGDAGGGRGMMMVLGPEDLEVPPPGSSDVDKWGELEAASIAAKSEIFGMKLALQEVEFISRSIPELIKTVDRLGLSPLVFRNGDKVVVLKIRDQISKEINTFYDLVKNQFKANKINLKDLKIEVTDGTSTLYFRKPEDILQYAQSLNFTHLKLNAQIPLPTPASPIFLNTTIDKVPLIESAYNQVSADLVDTSKKRLKKPITIYGGGQLHIEVQVLSDHYGEVIPLVERDCSGQRNNQKVSEETSHIPESISQKLRRAAVAATRESGYKGGLATVEFLVDPITGRITFLEVNTRPQVEHPVTEFDTQVDLVQTLLAVKMGARLSDLPQIKNFYFGANRTKKVKTTYAAIEKVMYNKKPDGHTIALRITAENPETMKFAPGRIDFIEYTANDDQAHFYTAYEATGGTVSPSSDSQIGHIFVHGHTRAEAVERITSELDKIKIFGELDTNIPFLKWLVRQPEFIEGRVHNRLYDRWILEQKIKVDRAEPQLTAVISSALLAFQKNNLSPTEIDDQGGVGPTMTPMDKGGFKAEPFRVIVNNEWHSFKVYKTGANRFTLVSTKDALRNIDVIVNKKDKSKYDVNVGGKNYQVNAFINDDRVKMLIDNKVANAELKQYDPSVMKSSMPGKVLEVMVKPGQTIKKGQVLMRYEAAKMNQYLVATDDAVVDSVNVVAGNNIDPSKPLINFKDVAAPDALPEYSNGWKLPVSSWHWTNGHKPSADIIREFKSEIDSLFNNYPLQLGNGNFSKNASAYLDYLNSKDYFLDQFLDFMSPRHSYMPQHVYERLQEIVLQNKKDIEKKGIILEKYVDAIKYLVLSGCLTNNDTVISDLEAIKAISSAKNDIIHDVHAFFAKDPLEFALSKRHVYHLFEVKLYEMKSKIESDAITLAIKKINERLRKQGLDEPFFSYEELGTNDSKLGNGIQLIIDQLLADEPDEEKRQKMAFQFNEFVIDLKSKLLQLKKDTKDREKYHHIRYSQVINPNYFFLQSLLESYWKVESEYSKPGNSNPLKEAVKQKNEIILHILNNLDKYQMNHSYVKNILAQYLSQPLRGEFYNPLIRKMENIVMGMENGIQFEERLVRLKREILSIKRRKLSPEAELEELTQLGSSNRPIFDIFLPLAMDEDVDIRTRALKIYALRAFQNYRPWEETGDFIHFQRDVKRNHYVSLSYTYHYGTNPDVVRFGMLAAINKNSDFDTALKEVLNEYPDTPRDYSQQEIQVAKGDRTLVLMVTCTTYINSSDDLEKAHFLDKISNYKARLQELGIKRITIGVNRDDKTFPKYYTYRIPAATDWRDRTGQLNRYSINSLDNAGSSNDEIIEDRIYRHIDPALAHILDFENLKNFALDRQDTLDPSVYVFAGKDKVTQQKIEDRKAELAYDSNAIGKDEIIAALKRNIDSRLFVRSNVRQLGTYNGGYQGIESTFDSSLINLRHVIRDQDSPWNEIYLNILPVFPYGSMPDARAYEYAQQLIMDRRADLNTARVKRVEFRYSIKGHDGKVGDRKGYRVVAESCGGAWTDITIYREKIRDGQTILEPLGEPINAAGSMTRLPEKAFALEPIRSLNKLDRLRLISEQSGMTYAYDWPDLYKSGLAERYRELGLSTPSDFFKVEEFYLDAANNLKKREPIPGGNIDPKLQPSTGAVAFEITMKTPEYPDGQKIILTINNDPNYENGSYSPRESELYVQAVEEAIRQGIPVSAILGNFGAAFDLDPVVSQFAQPILELKDPAKGESAGNIEIAGFYFSQTDYEANEKLRKAVIAEREELPSGEVRYILKDVIGSKPGLDSDSLSGSGRIAHTSDKAWHSIVTHAIVTGRGAIGIGSYKARELHRVIIIDGNRQGYMNLTGHDSINSLYQRTSLTGYGRAQDLAGPRVMLTSGQAYWSAETDALAVKSHLRELSHHPKDNKSVPPKTKYFRKPIDTDLDLPAKTQIEDTQFYIKQLVDDGYDPAQDAIMAQHAKTIFAANARIGGMPLLVMAVELNDKNTKNLIPQDKITYGPNAADLLVEDAPRTLPADSSFKIAELARKANLENKPILFMADLRGFVGGTEAMNKWVLKAGAEIISSLRNVKVPVYIYLPPHAQLRGGAWVVFDKNINGEDRIRMYSSEAATGGVVEPSVSAGVKGKKRIPIIFNKLSKEWATILDAYWDKINDPELKAKAAKLDPNKKEDQEVIREVVRLTLIKLVEKQQTPNAMLAMQSINGVIPWKDARRSLYMIMAKDRALQVLERSLLQINPKADFSELKPYLEQLETIISANFSGIESWENQEFLELIANHTQDLINLFQKDQAKSFVTRALLTDPQGAVEYFREHPQAWEAIASAMNDLKPANAAGVSAAKPVGGSLSFFSDSQKGSARFSHLVTPRQLTDFTAAIETPSLLRGGLAARYGHELKGSGLSNLVAGSQSLNTTRARPFGSVTNALGSRSGMNRIGGVPSFGSRGILGRR